MFRLAPAQPGDIPGLVEVIVPGRSNHDRCELPPVDGRVGPDGRRHLEAATLQRIGDESIVTMDLRQPLTCHEGDSLVQRKGSMLSDCSYCRMHPRMQKWFKEGSCLLASQSAPR